MAIVRVYVNDGTVEKGLACGIDSRVLKLMINTVCCGYGTSIFRL